MAYIGQEKKKEIAANLKQVLQGTGIKYRLGIRHHSTLYITLTEGPIDFIQNYIETCQPKYTNAPWNKPTNYLDVNVYWFHDHFTGQALEVLTKIKEVLNQGNHDNSNPQIDYFDVGWYVDIEIGKYDRPYIYTGVVEGPTREWTKEELVTNTLFAVANNEVIVRVLQAQDPKLLEQIQRAAKVVEPEVVKYLETVVA